MQIINKAITRSKMNYGASIWTPHIAETNWAKLEARQNDALRCATGYVRMTARDHLLTESQCMPVKEHCKVVTAQYATSVIKNHKHPCHKAWTRN